MEGFAIQPCGVGGATVDVTPGPSEAAVETVSARNVRGAAWHPFCIASVEIGIFEAFVAVSIRRSSRVVRFGCI